ncbi:MAG: glycosyltransferase family 2 protein [Methylobacter sp.]|nr:glycosyltransferase family 2 protein [Methylobacter sp.]
MKISIVTISFNQAEFLEKTISSVLAQKKDVDVEYIVIDAGSTDGSREIIEKYRPQINKVIFETDEGPSDGLNKGFSLAHGEIYGFLNSDDILYPNALKAVENYFVQHPEIDVISGHAYIIDSNNLILRKSFSQLMSLKQYGYGACIINQPSTFFRKHAFEKSKGFNKENRSNWDGELFVDMALAGAKFSVVNSFWSGYRLHSVSITASKKLDHSMRDYNSRIFEKIFGRPRQKIDSLFSILYRGWRFIKNPMALWERLSKGKIYGRNLTNSIAQK